MTKKISSEILADENRNIFREKVKFGKFSTESEHFSETEENLKQRGKCIIASEGVDVPSLTHTPTRACASQTYTHIHNYINYNVSMIWVFPGFFLEENLGF